MGLFDSLSIRDLVFPNRIVVSPMCQYSSHDGFATDWHLVHLGSRAIGGAGTVVFEATAVGAEGRISPGDLGLWKDDHIDRLVPITRFVAEHGVGSGMVADADGGLDGPSAIRFADGYPMPRPVVRWNREWESCGGTLPSGSPRQRTSKGLLIVVGFARQVNFNRAVSVTETAAQLLGPLSPDATLAAVHGWYLVASIRMVYGPAFGRPP